MISIDACIEYLKRRALAQENLLRKVERYYYGFDYEQMLSAAENSLRSLSNAYAYNRELLLSMYEVLPSLPHIPIEELESNALGVTVESMTQFRFPVYRITLPFLLPNKRRRTEDFKNAITSGVSSVVRGFCTKHHIDPFEHASVIFVSYYSPDASFITIVDNDNKEGTVIMNGLIGSFLRDDGATVCNTYYCAKTISDSRLKTEIYVVDSRHDLKVLSAIKSG